MLELDGVAVACQEILEETTEALSGGVLVDLKVIEVFASCSVPLEEVALTVLNGALRSHTHL